MTPELYWPTGVLLILTVLVFVVFARYEADRALQAVDIAQILIILAAPLLLVIPGWVTLRTGLWMSSGVAMLLVSLVVGADMNRPEGSAVGKGLQILLLPFSAVFLLLYRALSWFARKR